MKEEGLQKTPNGLINIAKPIQLDEDLLWNTLDKLYAEAYSETDSMKESVKKLVPTYTIEKRDCHDEIFFAGGIVQRERRLRKNGKNIDE